MHRILYVDGNQPKESPLCPPDQVKSGDPLDQGYFPVGEPLNIINTIK